MTAVAAEGGTPEADWGAAIAALPARTGTPCARRVIVLAPHPNSEVLGCGGAIQRWARGGALEIWHVTSGEASHGPQIDAASFASLREREALSAAAQLELPMHRRLWLAHPDGGVDVSSLVDQLCASLEPNSLVVAPWPRDGHPDYEATGCAAERAARACAAPSLFYPVWAWHHYRPNDPRLPLGRAWRTPLTALERSRKAHAIACFRSQITPRGPAEAALPQRVLAHFTRPSEVFFDGRETS
jgi:LmbE family N-acetylglucosaminyl deacetylase